METFPSINPDHGSAPKSKARVLVAQFGDGYSQRTGDGLNALLTTWSLKFTKRDQADMRTIETFLKAHGGYEAFEYTPSSESTARKWTCESWSGPTPEKGADNWSMSFTLSEVFDL